MKRYGQTGRSGLCFKIENEKKGIIMKKLLSVLLCVMLCMCVMVSAPWNRCAATEYPDDPVPCVDDGVGDDF